ITTDVMVGFPGETDDDFRAARSFIEQMRFGEMHVFPYSPRPGTKAAAFSPQVPQSVKKERVNSLLELNREMAMRYRKRFEGRVLPVIVEKIENGLARGHSDNYLEIAFSLSGAEINAIYPVRIVSAAYPLSRGEVIV
ncbi:MAG: tRNA (N(6)-L-threonylcarbamoyladenosine(37)-C(2))-methylthiotransferase MtaB, partial [Bacilli bacterium]